MSGVAYFQCVMLRLRFYPLVFFIFWTERIFIYCRLFIVLFYIGFLRVCNRQQ